MAGKAQKKPLPLKEQTLFKELLTLYESRTLKRALKTADQILKKVPDHGETLCMKGLVLTHMNRRDEGIDLVKKGLVFDMQSHICWHVLGIIKKADKNWDEALKAYTQAVRCDRENMNLLRDVAQLQVHLGNYDILQETRWQILKLRPNLRQNWIGYAVACHLNGNLSETIRVLRTYFSTLKNVPDYDVEHSEVLLYYNRVLEGNGEFLEALSQLDISAKERSIVDRTAIAESRARLLSELSRVDDASQAWRSLLDQNPESYDYYRGFLGVRGIDLDALTDESRPEALKLFADMSSQLPRATMPRWLALKTSQGEEFKSLILPYLLNGLIKGIPCLFVDVRTLYVDKEKRDIIEELMESFRERGEKGEGIGDSSISSNDPTVYIWTLYFLALHYSSPFTPNGPPPNLARSLDLLQRAIEHTPTLPELFMGKARVLKRAGDPFGAAHAMEDARTLDGKDRFLNWKAAKYFMRAGDVERAVQLLGLFTKKDAPSPCSDLEDMQCLAYMVEEGNAYLRSGNLGLALRRYQSVQMTFDEVENDQFDFHNYSLRRFTMNTYLNLLFFEKQLRSHPAYITAALASCKIYIQLHDDPSLATLSSSTAKLSDSDKKAKKKAKKAAQKTHEENKRTALSAKKDDDLSEPPKDEDYDGQKLLTTPNPLSEAMKWLKPLEVLAKNRVDVWVMVYDVTIRQKKFTQSLRALNAARRLDEEHPEVHVRIIDYCRRVSSVSTLPDIPTLVSALLASSLESLVPTGLSLETFNNVFVQRHSNSARAIFAAARVSRILDTSDEAVEDLIFGMLTPGVQSDFKICFDALNFLISIKSSRADEFRATAARQFPLSSIFGTADELAARREWLRKSGEIPESKEVDVM